MLNELIEFYIAKRDQSVPLEMGGLVTILKVRKYLFAAQVNFANEFGFTNVHNMLSNVALIFILHGAWLQEQGIDEKYAPNHVPSTGFDNKYPLEILTIFERSLMEVFPNHVLVKCAVRADKDFINVIYANDDTFKPNTNEE